MKKRIKNHHEIIVLVVFVALPLLIYLGSGFPKRTLLKEVISGLTVLAFFIMLLQFYLCRSNKIISKICSMSDVMKWHELSGCVFVSILLLHPFLIVLPRYLETNITPKEAFITILNQWNSAGIFLGLIAWGLIFILGISSIFRKRLGLSYKVWRILHGILSIAFIIVASFHVINSGRHINTPMAVLIGFLAIMGISPLLKIYLFNQEKRVENENK